MSLPTAASMPSIIDINSANGLQVIICEFKCLIAAKAAIKCHY